MNNWIKRLCTAAFFPAALTCILLPPLCSVPRFLPLSSPLSGCFRLRSRSTILHLRRISFRANIAWSGCFSQKQSLMSGMALRKLLRSSLRGKPESCWNAGGRLQSGNTIMLWKGAAINAFSSLMKTIFCMML